MSNLSQTADEILQCARSLIIAGGYNGFSYADIAEVVGIRKASIHHHFPSKADLVLTLVRRHRESLLMAVAGLEQRFSDPWEQLREYAGYWEACIGDQSTPFCVCALLASQNPVLPEEIALEVRAYFRALSQWLTGVMTRGQAAGSLVLARSPADEAEAFMATVHGAMISARAYGQPQMFGLITRPLIERLAASA
jgi:TetR/AcrR family transcriptional repressor of nem operon